MKTLKVPFSIDSRGGLATIDNAPRIVEQQIADLLVTARYERPMNPGYGLGVPEFVFSPIRQALLAQRAAEIKAGLAAVVQLADIIEVTITPSPDVDTRLVLDVRYSIRPSPQVFSMQQTVTGLATDESFGQTL
jgi:phage baseplate assembly protein W